MNSPLMRLTFDPFRLLLISLAGWINQQQQDVIEYLREENRVLHEQLGNKRLRFQAAVQVSQGESSRPPSMMTKDLRKGWDDILDYLSKVAGT